jgi:hypothetical protein
VTVRRVAMAGVVIAAALALAACGGPAHVAGSTTTSRPRQPWTPRPSTPLLTIAVDTGATPHGWVPVDFEDAQISVPPTWSDMTGGCVPAAPTVIVLDPGSYYGCPASARASFLQLLSHTTMAYSGKTSSTVVNGIQVSLGVGDRVWFAPSLGLTVTTSGTFPHATLTEVLRTLTYSPRAVALAPGPAPPIPTTWHRVTFAGLSIAVPSSWPVHKTAGMGCEPFVPVTTTLDAGTSVVGGNCLDDEGQYIVMAPADGLVVDPGRYRPLAYDNSFATCKAIDGLSACPAISVPGDAYYGVLVLAVHVPGTSKPVAVEIGLAGNGMVARTILYSMRPG